MAASLNLIECSGGRTTRLAVLVELDGLKWRQHRRGNNVSSFVLCSTIGIRLLIPT